MKTTRIDEELERELAAVAERCGCELVHIAFSGNSLRLVLDREEGGVDLSHCEAVSRQVSALLDTLDFGPGKYVLEVSSPGLDRQLYRDRDYERFVGHRVRVTWRSPEGGKRTDTGVLESFDAGGGGRIGLRPGEAEEVWTIRLADIGVARLEIEL